MFAEMVHNTWGVGDAACSNGVLLLLSVQDRVVRTPVSVFRHAAVAPRQHQHCLLWEAHTVVYKAGWCPHLQLPCCHTLTAKDFTSLHTKASQPR